jgi:hypothetical protein
MRIIVHTDDPDDMVYAMRAVKTSIEKGYKDCGYGYGNPERTAVYVRANQTGWTAYVTRSAAQVEKPE